MIGNDNNLEVYFGDNVGKSMEGTDKKEWFAFLEQLKHFSTRNLMSFGLKNLNRLRYSMQGQAAIKEGLFESWRGTRTVSYNDRPEAVRLMIRHKKPISEGDARYRYVESLYVETTDGERFKLPFTKLSGGRAMVEHVRNGGRPYDARGQHIAAVVEELNVLSRFRRANHGQVFEGNTAELISETNAYYENLNRVLKGLSTHRGYSNYFESWNPAEITEQDVVIESIKNLFVRETIDTRIEQALPVLARIQQQGQAMKEAHIFEAWANRLVEGTWATPDTPEKQAQLVELLSKEFLVGTDATNATEQLYDLVGDDLLFDQLETLADQDADADARQIVYDRLVELSDDPSIAEVLNQLNIDTDTPAEIEDPADELREEDDEASPVESAILRRIMNSNLDLLKQYGPAAVMAAARDVAEMIGDVEEIGSSDVSAYVKRVVQMLADGDYANLAEGQLNEFLPALGAVLGRAVVGAGAGALEKAAAGAVGSSIGSGIEDMFSSDEVDEGKGGTQVGDTVECPGGVTGKIIGDLGNKWLIKDSDAETDDDELEFNKSDCTQVVDEGTGGSYFVVFDDGQRPYGPIDQDKAQSISQRIAGTEVIPASQLASYQQANRQDAMKGSEPMEADNLSSFEEGRCNMTTEGEQCPMHGLKECGMEENLDTDGVMMTRASNMSSESVDPMLARMKSLAGILAK
jgi:hypothetical protein